MRRPVIADRVTWWVCNLAAAVANPESRGERVEGPDSGRHPRVLHQQGRAVDAIKERCTRSTRADRGTPGFATYLEIAD